MNAVHIKTDGMNCQACPARIEAELSYLPGVAASRAYAELDLTLVLFDPALTDTQAIRDRISDVGFGAQVLAARSLDEN